MRSSILPNVATAAFHQGAGVLAFSAMLAALATSACRQQPAAEATGGQVAAHGSTPAVKLLTAGFEPRSIRKIEVGDFHLTGGQQAPVHTHVAPALGYVSKGAIVYQVEGQPQQVLKAGDAFYEPVGPQILHFDNASQTEEAVFTDFNFERAGEPFIVFPKPLTVKIDRRTFPAVEIQGGPPVSAIDIVAQTIAPGASLPRATRPLPVMGYVADGTIELRTGTGALAVAAGQSFDVPAGQSGVTLANPSTNAAAKIVTFEPVL